MYHYKIDRRSGLWWTRDLEDVTWSCMGANRRSINICLDATNGQPPTAPQRAALAALLAWLVARFPRARGRTWGHGELTAYGNRTTCPGPDLVRFAQELRAERRTE